jgi:hypothetical protein
MAHLPDTYIIINIADLPNVDFDQVGETSEQTIRKSLDETQFVEQTIRKSLDETQFVLKYEHDEIPTFITDGTITPVSTLSHSECLVLMASAEWSEPEPITE